MKATELRIGNYVNLDYPITDPSKLVRISPNHIKDIFQSELASVPSHQVQIPLTEDWLINFGFEKCKGRHGDYFKHKKQELFRVWKNDCEVDCWGIGRKDNESLDREYNTHWIKLDLKYLHQLQNLFFALTGEELQLKAEAEKQ